MWELRRRGKGTEQVEVAAVAAVGVDGWIVMMGLEMGRLIGYLGIMHKKQR